jgi:hypothetical protein
VQRSGAVAFVLAAVALVAVAAGCGGTTTVVRTRTVTLEPPRDTALFGHIQSLTRKGDHYVMRFDPAWFLSGETANTAAAADGAVDPGQPVPNDNYVVEEGHRLLTYLVPGRARVFVLTRAVHPERITVAELAKILSRTSAMRLFESLDSGVWITVRIDTVRTIVQQYRP